MIRIGTRDSKLAVWQAEFVANALQKAGHETELVYIKTEGDLVLDTPLPLMGGKGVFTKALDDALITNEIDIAVHSHKDIPTQIPDGLQVSAVFEREDPRDVIVLRQNHPLHEEVRALGSVSKSDIHSNMRMGAYIAGRGSAAINYNLNASPEQVDQAIDSYFSKSEATIATSSTRRQGQWLHRYPHHAITDIRGNVQTRLRKLDEGRWDAAIFAAAGLLRLGLQSRISSYLDWMVPAPAQGAVAVMSRTGDVEISEIMATHHHLETAICIGAERQCLRRLEGGCSAPVGVHMVLENGSFTLYANVLSLDGKQSLDVTLEAAADDTVSLSRIGLKAAEMLLQNGANSLLESP